VITEPPGFVAQGGEAPPRHYLWGKSAEGWHLFDEPELSVIRERIPQGESEVRHRHERARQLFVVMEGCAAIEVDGESVHLGPGQVVLIRPRVPHTVANAGQEDLRLLVVSQPHSHGDRVTSPGGPE
jgi:mannose-6-phosphate isomerase-like protein (cupin superfamily)